MRVKSAITISLVPEARGGPFVFWDDLEQSCKTAAELGYDGVELFLPSPECVGVDRLKELLDFCGLELAAVGTGAGWVIHKLNLTTEDDDTRESAKQYIRQMIDFGAAFGAPAIIGSMQGNRVAASHDMGVERLCQALEVLADHAGQRGTPLIYEPLNRYETDLCHTVAEGAAIIDRLDASNVVLLADLFHMNIEETDPEHAIAAYGKYIGHIHFADSNRRAIGFGHTRIDPVVKSLQEIGYEGWISAEIFPWPAPREAAEANIAAFRRCFAD